MPGSRLYHTAKRQGHIRITMLHLFNSLGG
jgi:hypothetical protein